MRIDLEYGDGYLPITVPDSTPVIRAGDAFEEPAPLEDPVEATRQALANPIGSKRIGEVVDSRSKVVIGFPDRVKGGFHSTAHRKVAIPLILDELERAGVKDENIKLVCGIGLHRMNTHEEFASYLGEDIVKRFGYTGVVNHDAEDPEGIVVLGKTDHGDWVDFNRHAFEADLTIMLGHTMGNPYGGYSGGYKMPCTGFTSWRSIRCHHTPATMYRDDFVPVSTESHFRRQLRAIGSKVESEMNKDFFLVDAVLNGRSQQMQVVAGSPSEVEEATWPKAATRTDIEIGGDKANVLVLGIPRSFHYGPGMGTNPVLMLQGMGSWVARAAAVMEKDFVVIAASICDGWFNESWFPAYESIYDKLQDLTGASELIDFEEEFATNPEWVHKYRREFAYHPFHGFSMAYMGSLATRQALSVYVVGAKKPGYARGMGCTPVATFEDAVERSRRLISGEPRMLVVPAVSKPAVHLRAAG
ncbi:MAG: lactate racemase domain-containing protein [Trueperaceae bacterium]